MSKPFKLNSAFKPSGDQPEAIRRLEEGLEDGTAHQTLLGVTGSGKTFTIANVIADLQRPTMVLAPNKTLAAQLYGEMKEFFPENAVEYFVSYYDYYQPEAYVPSSDTFIEKDARLTNILSRCVYPPPKRCWSGVMWLWWRLFPRFMVWAILIYISR